MHENKDKKIDNGRNIGEIKEVGEKELDILEIKINSYILKLFL